MKRFSQTFLLAVLIFATTPLLARTASFSAQNFKPAFDTGNHFQLLGSQTLSKGNFSLGIMSDYAHESVVLERPAGIKFQNIVAKQISANLTAAYGILDWLDVGLLVATAPYIVFQPADTTTEQTRIRMGDVRVSARIRLLDNKKHGGGLSLIPMATIPTGNGNSFVGDNKFSGGGMLVLDSKRLADRFSLSLNAGYEVRSRAVLTTTAAGAPQTVMNDLVHYGLGGNLAVHPKVDLIAELRGFTLAGDLFNTLRPMDYAAGLRIYPKSTWAVSVGGGSAIITGIGNPVFRAFAGLAYVPEHKSYKKKVRIPKNRDIDGDGVSNSRDRCPTEAGPESNGGCPEEAKIVLTPEEFRVLTRPIHFNFEKATLRPDSLPTLKVLAEAIKAKPIIKRLAIEGHTDHFGTELFNQWLSEERARVVKEHLVEFGINPLRLEAMGHGESRPIDPAKNIPAYRKNRRVEFIFREVEGMEIPDPVLQAVPATLPESGPVKTDLLKP